MQSTAKKAALPAITLAALGVVFGDIGTSPLYALKESFHAAHGLGIQPENVLGILSIIFWCLMLIISIKYIAIVMRADNNGEGGIMALLALNLRKAKISDSKKIYLIAIGFVGASLFFGDGIITPAISVLSAVEGLSIATNVLDPFIVPIAIVIVTTLFLMQKHGTAFVGKFFGPITLLWFLSLKIMKLPPQYARFVLQLLHLGTQRCLVLHARWCKSLFLMRCKQKQTYNFAAQEIHLPYHA
jgi:KUP system potassium uptake protein